MIDDDLMAKALESSGLKTKKAVVEAGLRLVIQLGKQSKIRSLRGKLRWEGDLDSMRGKK